MKHFEEEVKEIKELYERKEQEINEIKVWINRVCSNNLLKHSN